MRWILFLIYFTSTIGWHSQLFTPFAQAQSQQGPDSDPTATFTGHISSSTFEAAFVLFSPDRSYCAEEKEGDACERKAAVKLLVTDTTKILEAYATSEPSDIFDFGMKKTLSDYEELMGLSKGQSLLKAGPQKININSGLSGEFNKLTAEDQITIENFYNNLDRRLQDFRVHQTAQSAKTSTASLSQAPPIFLGDKIENVVSENGQALKPGWLWQVALIETKNDPVKAMRLLAFCGTSFGLFYQMKNHQVFQCPKMPTDFLAFPQGLSSQAGIPQSLEKQIQEARFQIVAKDRVDAPKSSEEIQVTRKEYHVYSAAYMGCMLASRGHPIAGIVAVEKAMASAYRDLTFRQLFCEKKLPPGDGDPADQPSPIKDDALVLMQQIKRDGKSTNEKLASIKNTSKWNDTRLQAAMAQVKVWLLDWDWTIAQHEAGARWGAEACSKARNIQ